MQTIKTKLLNLLQHPKKLLLVLYATLLCVWLLLCAVAAVYDYAAPQEQLDIADAEVVNLELGADGWYTSTSEDPQLHFMGLATPLRRVVLQCEFEDVPGEIDLYYMRRGDEGFSTNRRVFGRLLANGSYEFTLPPGQVTAIRIDPGSIAANKVHLYGVRLNSALPVWQYFAPSLRQLLGFGLWPALAHVAIYTIIEMVPEHKNKKTAKRGKETQTIGNK